MSTLPNDPLLREIDEEVRHDEMIKLLKSYAPFITAVVAVALVVVGGYQGYHFWQHKKALETAAAWEAAVSTSATSRDEEIKAMAAFAATHDGGYHSLALLRKANAEQGLDKTDDAIKTYMALADDAKSGPEFRELGLLFGAYLQLAGGKADEVRAKIEAAASKSDAVYPALFREWLAVADISGGKNVEAAKIFAELAQDASAPKQLQQRALAIAHVALLKSGGEKK